MYTTTDCTNSCPIVGQAWASLILCVVYRNYYPKMYFCDLQIWKISNLADSRNSNVSSFHGAEIDTVLSWASANPQIWQFCMVTWKFSFYCHWALIHRTKASSKGLHTLVHSLVHSNVCLRYKKFHTLQATSAAEAWKWVFGSYSFCSMTELSLLPWLLCMAKTTKHEQSNNARVPSVAC